MHGVFLQYRGTPASRHSTRMHVDTVGGHQDIGGQGCAKWFLESFHAFGETLPPQRRGAKWHSGAAQEMDTDLHYFRSCACRWRGLPFCLVGERCTGEKTCSLKCANLFNDAGLVRKSRYAMDIDCADVTKYNPRAFMRAPMYTSDAKLTLVCGRERFITPQPLNGTTHKRCMGRSR